MKRVNTLSPLRYFYHYPLASQLILDRFLDEQENDSSNCSVKQEDEHENEMFASVFVVRFVENRHPQRGFLL